MRAISFVTRSLLPDHRSGHVHTCDWYTAFCEMPGVDARLEADADLRGVAKPGVADAVLEDTVPDCGQPRRRALPVQHRGAPLP